MFIYAIGTETNKQKIGFSSNPEQRLVTLQTGCPEKLKIHHVIEVADDRARIIENQIHKELSYKRMRGEWFQITKKEAVELLIFAEIRWVDDPLLG